MCSCHALQQPPKKKKKTRARRSFNHYSTFTHFMRKKIFLVSSINGKKQIYLINITKSDNYISKRSCHSFNLKCTDNKNMTQEYGRNPRKYNRLIVTRTFQKYGPKSLPHCFISNILNINIK